MTGKKGGPVVVAAFAMRATPDKRRNLDRMTRAVVAAARHGAGLVVFPEYALTGQAPSPAEDRHHTEQMAEPVPAGPSVRAVAELARIHGCHIAFGMVERVEGPHGAAFFNTAVLVGPSGFVGRYRKVHLYRAERALFSPGDGWPVFDTPYGRAALLLCYDLTFPEAARSCRLQGAELLLVPSAWPLSRRGGEPTPADDPFAGYFRLYQEVRALENQCWLVAANQVGWTGRSDYAGQAAIIDPRGRPLARTGHEEGIALAAVDLAGGLAAARAMDDFLADRRPACYGWPAPPGDQPSEDARLAEDPRPSRSMSADSKSGKRKA
ncbi:MAG: carbon-nitrogen hydrolase family protein [Clostridia bacterium]|nr:carbon-nitrogen hydrolase family protein [Clostridia bacterium]